MISKIKKGLHQDYQFYTDKSCDIHEQIYKKNNRKRYFECYESESFADKLHWWSMVLQYIYDLLKTFHVINDFLKQGSWFWAICLN